MAWQLKSVPLIDGDRIFVNGWEIGGDRAQPKIPEFAQALAEHDKNHDGKISPSEMAGKNAEWFSDNDLNHDGYLDEREWQVYQVREAAENCLVAIRCGGRGDVTR